MEHYKFDFSVVMAVYNVEAYLRESLESLIHQTIGFSRIQVILVDDGSTDDSGLICDVYKKKYPENIIVIHKENGRQASARNMGLSYIEGKYVNFLDPDDTLEVETMKKVRLFMDEHTEVGVCCIPINFFGEKTGSHMLNDKFQFGTRVIDLLNKNNAQYILMSTASSFYRHSIARSIKFDTELYHAEDAKENLRILLETPLLGVVADTRYNYRRYGSSTISKSLGQKGSYINHLKLFSLWAIEQSKQKYGQIPLFVQNTIMYDLQWKLKQDNIPEGILTDEEINEYKKLLISIISQINDKVILAQKYLEVERKYYILRRKYENNDHFMVEKSLLVNRHRLSIDGKKKETTKDIAIIFGDIKVTMLSDLQTELDFLYFDTELKAFYLEGYHHICGYKKENIKPVLLINNETVSCDLTDRAGRELQLLGDNISQVIGFKAYIPVSNQTISIKVGISVGDIIIPRKRLRFGCFFPLTGLYKNSYANFGDRRVYLKGNVIKIIKKPNAIRRLCQETMLLAEIWKKNLQGGRKAILGRIYYYLLIPFKRHRLWIISDRIMKADDNGEALFIYLMNNKPKGVDIVFAISNKSADYARLLKIGRCINAMSFQHKLLHLLCDLVISSHADGTTRNPYFGHDDALRDLLVHQRYVFLQHGIIMNDVSNWLNKYSQNIDGFVTSSCKEKQSIVEGNYYYDDKKVWLVGLPRYDRLYCDNKKRITIMPTWRKYLMDAWDSKTGMWTLSRDFEQSEYFLFYNELINSKKLLHGLRKYEYALQFFPHPTIQPHVNRFSQSSDVLFLSLNTSYREVYAKSSLIVTDYSSAVFDFSYLRKPVIYCQFDRERFFAGDHVTARGYFNFEQDGFGEVAYDLEYTIDLILDYVKNGCQLKDKYRKRIDDFFAFHDCNNCKRVTDKILELDKKC